MYSRSNRSAAIAITLFGSIVNFFLAIQVLTIWRSVKWEPESEWEGSSDPWKLDGVKIVGALLAAYFAAAAVVSFLGFIGIVNNKHSLVRFYRDSAMADFLFCTFFAIVGTYHAFGPSLRTSVCEELSRHPELMHDLVEMGVNIENCEPWFQRAILAFMAFLVVLSVVRLHFLMAVSHYYSHITAHRLPLHAPKSTDPSVQRIFLLSRSQQHSTNQDDVLLYAQVPLSSLSPEAAQDLRSTATEAWISRDSHAAPAFHNHSHRHRHHGSLGRINLPIRPNEGLLPAYDEDKLPI
jgi:hypothetical protein